MDTILEGGNRLSEADSRDGVSAGRPVEGGGEATAGATRIADEEGAAKEGESSVTTLVCGQVLLALLEALLLSLLSFC